MTAVGGAAEEYVRAGLVLVEIERGLKGPRRKRWNLRENCIDAPADAAALTGNVGLAHAYSGTCCIDIDDLTKAVPWFDQRGIDLLAHWHAPDAVRLSSGLPNRGKLLYRMPAGIDPLASRMFKADGVELRCATGGGLTVQDVLPPSIHPSTKQPYRWLGPGDWSKIPEIPADLLSFWQALNERPVGITATAPRNVGREDLDLLLSKIKPATLDYDEWLYVGMALHHETQGHQVGLDIWDIWSCGGGDKYKGREELVPKWEGFRLDVENPRTLRTIERMAEEQTDMSQEWQKLDDDVDEAEADDISADRGKDILLVKPVSMTVLDSPPAPPKVIVEQLLLEDACGFVAPGGTGKTTLGIYEAIHIILGRPLWGREIVKPGAVLFFTAEDSREMVESRLTSIVAALRLNREERSRVAAGFYIEDVADKPQARLVEVANSGRIKFTPLLLEICRRYADVGLSLVHVDPASLLGPGEQIGADGFTELMRGGRYISRKVKAACQIIHHVSQTVARGGIQDQYAGRGSTSFADNSRGQRQLVRIKKRAYEFDGRIYNIPASISDETMAAGRVLAILVHKLSYVELNPHPIFFERRGFAFEQFDIQASNKARENSPDENVEIVAGLISRELENGRRHSKSVVEGMFAETGLKRNAVRDAIGRGLTTKRFELADLPPREKGRGKATFLAVVESDDYSL